MCILSCRMLQCLTVLFLTSLVESQRIVLRSGRHVCRQEKTIFTPVARTKTVCVPFYQRSYLPCHYPNRGICPFVRLMYRTEFRRVNEMVPRRQTYFSCCPGWTGYDVTHNACSKPVCDPKCHHGGDCRLPNRCKCPDGWNGTSCQSDVDECRNSPCDQKCTNTGGSFRCECFQGYRLAPDGRSCSLCLSCTEEFTSILQEQKRLQATIIRLEEHNNIMMKNLTSLHEDLMTLTSLPRPTLPLPTPTPEEKGPTAEDISDELDAYMSSISEQIAMLEERLDVCTCSKSSRAGLGNGHQTLTPFRVSSSKRRLEAKHQRPRTTSTPATTTMMTTTEKDYLLYKAPSK